MSGARQKKDSLLDAQTMDGPVVKWTVLDLFKGNNRLCMTYHVMGAGWDFMSPIGGIVGGVLYGVGYRPFPALSAMIGTSGMIGGCVGVTLGLGLMTKTAVDGVGPNGLAWDDDGIQTRIDGLSHNFTVRVMDKSAWAGLTLAAGAMLLAPDIPKKLGLSAGAFGIVQGLTLGSVAGSLAGMACISSNKRNSQKALEEDD